ncbi:CPBP family intramembrane metalloprotease [Pontixanthobacter aestiaquae]|uniref:CPBP family intramembrane metalloprotease n=1 Tax=Pontixanthobacter aestiaquae TaxID=1509367 RepID=A0A844ZAN0_9SPHN|nr:CPBP family intramembrane glutamic endopeptidase [Pontixanthobacter aestiaquae]MDN3644912.1 CPBP family intramembrane metalloprotease [Pontixanthobacter aestiaquae]MXO84087.1 CPBP family intramembrane metalloprotease [Pontixanthobacter aestiaquae]
MSNVQTASADTPLWKTVLDFPLVTMVVAGALFLLASVGTDYLFWKSELSFGETGDLVAGTLLPVLAGVLIYKLVIARMGKHKKDDMPAQGMFGDTLLGLGVGAAIFTTVVGIAAVLGVYRILGPGGSTDLLQIVLLAGVSAGVLEEILLRGIIFRWLEEFAGSLVALVISSALFGFGHAYNPNATLFSSIAIAIEAGILLGGAYMLTRSLWLAIGLHAGWNVTQSYIWGLPVSGFDFDGLVEGQLYGEDWLSGGLFGLEASVIALGVATAAGIWMVWQAAKQGNWVKPMWSRNDG